MITLTTSTHTWEWPQPLRPRSCWLRPPSCCLCWPPTLLSAFARWSPWNPWPSRPSQSRPPTSSLQTQNWNRRKDIKYLTMEKERKERCLASHKRTPRRTTIASRRRILFFHCAYSDPKRTRFNIFFFVRSFSIFLSNLHFESVVFQPDGPDFNPVLLEQIPDVSDPELDRVVPDVDLVLRPGEGRRGKKE